MADKTSNTIIKNKTSNKNIPFTPIYYTNGIDWCSTSEKIVIDRFKETRPLFLVVEANKYIGDIYNILKKSMRDYNEQFGTNQSVKIVTEHSAIGVRSLYFCSPDFKRYCTMQLLLKIKNIAQKQNNPTVAVYTITHNLSTQILHSPQRPLPNNFVKSYVDASTALLEELGMIPQDEQNNDIVINSTESTDTADIVSKNQENASNSTQNEQKTEAEQQDITEEQQEILDRYSTGERKRVVTGWKKKYQENGTPRPQPIWTRTKERQAIEQAEKENLENQQNENVENNETNQQTENLTTEQTDLQNATPTQTSEAEKITEHYNLSLVNNTQSQITKATRGVKDASTEQTTTTTTNNYKFFNRLTPEEKAILNEYKSKSKGEYQKKKIELELLHMTAKEKEEYYAKKKQKTKAQYQRRKERLNNLPPDEKQAYMEKRNQQAKEKYQRKKEKINNLSPEEQAEYRAKQRERVKNYYNNLTPEKQAEYDEKRNAYYRNYYANLTPEQKQKKLEQNRKSKQKKAEKKGTEKNGVSYAPAEQERL